jgi:hypothetical protein
MANLCFYEIQVKGTKKACYAYMVTTPMMDDEEILLEKGTDEDFILHFTGCCKWSLDYYCEDEYDEEVNLDSFSLEEIKEAENGIKILGGKIKDIVTTQIEDFTRTAVIIEKIKPTDVKFPRSNAQIRKKPL